MTVHRVRQVDLPVELTAPDVYEWRAFSGDSLDTALAEFRRKYPQFYDTAPVLVWVRSNKTLYVAMDVRRK
mgnify:CR=1 FL=1